MVRAYADRIPQLEAHESLLAQVRVAMGSGTLPADRARTILDDWTRAARAGGQASGIPGHDELRRMGIAVRQVPG